MNEYETVEWEQCLRHIQSTWQQGEHVAVIGPTGVGKTTLVSRILPVRRCVVVFVTKVHDDTITNDFKGFTRLEQWPKKGPPVHMDKILLWPKPEKTMRGTIAKQRFIFKQAMDKMFLDRNWCAVFDEQNYVCRELNLEPENKMFQHQGRSSGLSVVNGSQRPAFVPLVTMSGSTHVFLWQTTLEPDLKRLSDIGGIDKRQLVREMLTLDKHEFIYLNTRKGLSLRSQVER